MRNYSINISRYIFLILFLGLFASNTFFDHTHICDGNIIVHSHPFKPDRNGNPVHGHTDSGYLLINLINNFVVIPGLEAALASIIVFFYLEIIARSENAYISSINISRFFLRGPPRTMSI